MSIVKKLLVAVVVVGLVLVAERRVEALHSEK